MMQSHVDQNDGFCPKSYYWLTFRRFDTAAVALFSHTESKVSEKMDSFGSSPGSATSRA